MVRKVCTAGPTGTGVIKREKRKGGKGGEGSSEERAREWEIKKIRRNGDAITRGEIEGGQIQLKSSKSTTWRKNCLYRSDLSMRLCDMILSFRMSSNQNLSDYILFVLILIYLY